MNPAAWLNGPADSESLKLLDYTKPGEGNYQSVATNWRHFFPSHRRSSPAI